MHTSTEKTIQFAIVLLVKFFLASFTYVYLLLVNLLFFKREEAP